MFSMCECVYVYMVLQKKPQGLTMLHSYSTTEVHPSPSIIVLIPVSIFIPFYYTNLHTFMLSDMYLRQLCYLIIILSVYSKANCFSEQEGDVSILQSTQHYELIGNIHMPGVLTIFVFVPLYTIFLISLHIFKVNFFIQSHKYQYGYCVLYSFEM